MFFRATTIFPGNAPDKVETSSSSEDSDESAEGGEVETQAVGSADADEKVATQVVGSEDSNGEIETQAPIA